MSSDPTRPITPARFAAALKDLSVASLHLKTLELRNSLAHLAYSNAQLRPFADGTETSLDTPRDQPDPDCVEAIRENEAVMARMRERILLVRAEVEGRGLSWREFEVVGVEDDEPGAVATSTTEEGDEEEGAGRGGSRPLTNGVNGSSRNEANEAATARDTSTTAGNPWTDGTFQMGVIRNGEIHMDPPNGAATGSGAGAGAGATTTSASNAATGGAGGGRLSDEELRRMVEERLAEDEGDEEDGGLHL